MFPVVFLSVLALAGFCHGDGDMDKHMASCQLTPNKVMGSMQDTVTGMVKFTEKGDGVVHVRVELEGFDKEDAHSAHGFHVHAGSDISASCSGAGGHYNPTNTSHGAPTADNRHVGDLGNIAEDTEGRVEVDMTDSMIQLTGEHSIIGRAIVVHEKADDFGLGGAADSLTTGAAGGRLACCIIEQTEEDTNGSGGAFLTGSAVLTAASAILFFCSTSFEYNFPGGMC